MSVHVNYGDDNANILGNDGMINSGNNEEDSQTITVDNNNIAINPTNDENENMSSDESVLQLSSADSEQSTDSEEETYREKRRKKIESTLQTNKKLRVSGESYVNSKNKRIEKKTVLPNPCHGKRCLNTCNNFTENERDSLFKTFWKLESYNEKRAFINGCVNIVPVKRRRTRTENSRRCLTYQYFFMKNNSQSRVCQQFLMTLLVPALKSIFP